MTRQISPYTEQVVSALNEAHTPQQDGNHFWHHRFYAMVGQRFDRIVKQSQLTAAKEAPYWSNEQRLVLSFVDRETGDIHYSAGWKAPAKWKDGPAVEWHADDAERYAQFVRDGGWGYKGMREAWEAKNPVEPEPIADVTPVEKLAAARTAAQQAVQAIIYAQSYTALSERIDWVQVARDALTDALDTLEERS